MKNCLTGQFVTFPTLQHLLWSIYSKCIGIICQGSKFQHSNILSWSIYCKCIGICQGLRFVSADGEGQTPKPTIKAHGN